MQEGDQFPKFELQDEDGRTVTNADLSGQKSIVYFYPKDDTTGCTAQACGFRDGMPRFKGARVGGVSPDSVKSHKRFATKYSLNFTLLADPEKKLIVACGLWVEKTLYGRRYMGVERTTFLLDQQGRIIKLWHKVKPVGHAEEVLAALAA